MLMITKFPCLLSRVLLANHLHPTDSALSHVFMVSIIGCQPIGWCSTTTKLSSLSSATTPLESILVCSDVIYPLNSVKNKGAWFDTVMSMDKQIKSICQSAFYHLRNIAQISKHLSFCHRETLIHAFVTSKIDQYNIQPSGLRKDQIRRLQYAQNSAARLLTGSSKHEHTTLVLRNLHWLPVHERTRFKILLMTFKCLNQLPLSYLSDLLIHYRP